MRTGTVIVSINNHINKRSKPWRNNCVRLTSKVVVYAMERKMKYFLACLIIPFIPILLIAVFGIGALYFAVANQLEQSGQ